MASIFDRIKSASDAFWRPSNVGFGPGEPLRPAAPKEAPRRNDYMVSRNTMWTPRAEEGRAVTYSQMRAVARLHGVLRTVIEKRKDEIKGLEWDISVKPEYANGTDYKDEINRVRKFWEKPDLETPFDQWLNAVLEDLYVIDAPTLFKERDRLGRFRSLQIIDGATIKVLVNDSGRIPKAPELAFEQIIKGQPRTGYVKPIPGINPYLLTGEPRLVASMDVETFTNFNELYYRPYNIASDGVYGFSHVESIIMTVNMALRRDTSLLKWFTDGNIPAALASVPENWTADQIDQFQTMFDTYLAGDLGKRSGLHFIPSGMNTLQGLQQLTFDSIFDQWLARIICARFNTSPLPYVSQINRAVSEQMEEASRDEGLVPVMQYLCEWFNDIIENDMGCPHLQFKWVPGQNYGKDDAFIDDMRLKAGAMTIDQFNEQVGKPALENGLGNVPLILNGGTWMRLADVVSGKTLPQSTPQAPLGGQDTLPRLSIGQDDNEGRDEAQDAESSPLELSLKAVNAELDAWERFAIKRCGKKAMRQFESKLLPFEIVSGLSKYLTADGDNPESIKAIFDTARTNLNRRRTPPVGDSLDKLMAEYKGILEAAGKQAMEKVT